MVSLSVVPIPIHSLSNELNDHDADRGDSFYSTVAVAVSCKFNLVILSSRVVVKLVCFKFVILETVA